MRIKNVHRLIISADRHSLLFCYLVLLLDRDLAECRTTKATENEALHRMDSLPNELCCIVLQCVPPYMRPVLAMVSWRWNHLWAVMRGPRVSGSFDQTLAKAHALPLLKWVHERCGLAVDGKTCAAAAGAGALGMLQWLLDEAQCVCDPSTCARAAESEHEDVLRWVQQRGCPWDERTCAALALHGNLALLDWAHRMGCPCDRTVIDRAVSKGHVIILDWALAHGLHPDPSSSIRAAITGHIDVLEWLLGKGYTMHRNAINGAAAYGHTHVIQWMLSHGCTWNTATINTATTYNRLDTVQWLRAQGCPWSESAPACAAEHDHLHILEWLIDNGCPYDANRCARVAIEYRRMRVLEWLLSAGRVDTTSSLLTQTAIQKGHHVMLLWLLDHGFPLCANAHLVAARWSNVQTLEWLLDQGHCQWDVRILLKAAKWCKISVLEWAKERSHPMHPEMLVAAAAKCDTTEALEWIVDNLGEHVQECFTLEVFENAIAVSELDTLRWLWERRKHDVQELGYYATLNGRVDALDWLREKGCRIDYRIYTASSLSDSRMRRYVDKHWDGLS